MTYARLRSVLVRLALVLVVVAVFLAASGCTAKTDSGSGGTGGNEAAKPEPAPEPEPAPTYRSWVVYINDDDSFTQGTVTYSIALNLTATNPTGNIAGKYKGTATATTGTNGTVNGLPLTASAVAKSSQLQFTLEEGAGDLAAITTGTATYGGTGTITMGAAGSGSIAGAGGSFSNNSSQPLNLFVVDDKVTLSVPINGHTYKFTGTISGKE